MTRRRVAIVLAMLAGLIAVLSGWAYFAVMGLPGFLQLPPSARERSATIRSLENRVKASFGSDLESVDVRCGRKGTVPTYFGSFSLKGIPLEFRFEPSAVHLATFGLSSSALVDNERIGGSGRLVKLARRFVHDFPGHDTLYYWHVNREAYVTGSRSQIAKLLENKMGPSVVVYDRNDYWSDGLARSLGVYSWSQSSGDWELVYRGSIEEFR